MTVRIFTTVVNRPEFVNYQALLFKKYLQNDFEFHVVDDSVEKRLTARYLDVCSAHRIAYHRKMDRYAKSDPSGATAAAIQWTFDTIIKPKYAYDTVLLLDSDMFLIECFDAEEFIQGYTIAGLLQRKGHVDYVTNGLMVFNMPEIMAHGGDLDFSAGVVEGCDVDTAGHLYYFIHRPGVRVRETDPDCHPQYPSHYKGIPLQGHDMTKGYNVEIHCGGKFLHYRAGSNWFKGWRTRADPLPEKTRLFERMLLDRL